jgi:fluoroacetyl-CoA thioesterase
VSEPEPNAIGTAELVVQHSDCASDLKLDNVPDENFPSVFATTRMIALMEMAGARVRKPLLREGEMSVGVRVDIIHSAATPIGARRSQQPRIIEDATGSCLSSMCDRA